MNISEAGNAQILLNWLLGGGRPTESLDSQRARQAAEQLADRAHRALQTGWTSRTVAAAWPHHLDGPPDPARTDRGDRGEGGPGFLDSPARSLLLQQISAGPGPGQHPGDVQHPSEGEER